MTTYRTVVRQVLPEPTTEGAGVRLERLIAGRQLDWLDPFLLLDHFGSGDPADYEKGFPMHPHRGIETVTYLLEGEVAHRDTTGSAGVIRAGGVQWMTAGGGILHEEMPRAEGGRLDGFQLWVNLPARQKMSKPRYQEFSAEEIPVVERGDGTRIKVIAGQTDGVRGAVGEIAMQPTYLDVALAPNARFEQPVASGHSAFAYLYRGSGQIGLGADGQGTKLEARRLAVLSDGDRFAAQAGPDGARFLLVSGAPTREAIARYGPFVMNTREELKQALDDLEHGTFVWSPERAAR